MKEWIKRLFKRKKFVVVGFHPDVGIYYSEPMDEKYAKYCIKRGGVNGCTRMYYQEVNE